MSTYFYVKTTASLIMRVAHFTIENVENTENYEEETLKHIKP